MPADEVHEVVRGCPAHRTRGRLAGGGQRLDRGSHVSGTRAQQFEATYTEVIALVEGLSDDELNEAGRYSWLDADVVLWFPVGGNTFDHYEEHLEILASGGDGEAAGGAG